MMSKKHRDPATSLSSRERQLMDAIFRLGEAAAKELEAELPDSLANATIRTMLRILEEKGHLLHREEGRRFVYYPKRPKKQEAAGALQRLLGVFYNGSMTEAFSGMLALRDTELSDEEYEELRDLIDSAKRKKQKYGKAGK